jgi:glycosyltransferase involved in cell wall biosynthesis
MRILYLSQYFPPEAGATQTRAYEMAHNWILLGHSVTMITEFPNHPSGIIPSSYRGKLFERTILDGIDVIRVRVKASPKKNYRNRMMFYLTYAFNAILASIFLAKGGYDLLYASSPPLFVGGAALVIRALKHLPLIFEVRDLWPESAVALGELSNSHIISWATKLEESCYRKADLVIVVTQGIFNRLRQRGIPSKKIKLVPNGANTNLFSFSSEDRENIRAELDLEGKFILIYAGIHGLAQRLETIVETARILQGDPTIHFIFIGDGPKKFEILSQAKEYHLSNITFLPEKPREQIPGYLSASDVSLVPLRKSEIFKGALPSKIFDAWACERPVIISIDGEARQIVESARGGIYISPEDPLEMSRAIKKLKDSPSERMEMGKNGRKFTIQNYSRKAQAEILITHLVNIVKYPNNNSQ